MREEPESVRRGRTGNGLAADELPGAYVNAMGAVAYAIVNDARLAEDAVCTACAQAARQRDVLAASADPAPWLVRLAREAALDLLRERRYAAAPADTDAAREALRRVVAKLPRAQREIFMMRYVAGLGYEAIAEASGHSRDTVAQSLWRARQRIAEELGLAHALPDAESRRLSAAFDGEDDEASAPPLEAQTRDDAALRAGRLAWLATHEALQEILPRHAFAIPRPPVATPPPGRRRGVRRVLLALGAALLAGVLWYLTTRGTR